MKTQTHSWCRRIVAALSGLALVSLATVAHADATGSWDGNFAVSSSGEIAVTTGNLTESAGAVSGTVTIEFLDASAAGTYLQSGSGSASAQATALGGLFMLASLPCCFVWLAFGAGEQRLLRTRRARRLFNGAMGLLLGASVVLILLEGV